MKRKTKILSIIIPIILVAVISLGIILPTTLADSGGDSLLTLSFLYDYQTASADEETGASASSSGYKGGAIFLEPNAHFTMKGGTISGHDKKYGGAIYISDGAVFTMTGGTIKNNKADYGGAIYVESGGECYIDGGEISNNGCRDGGPAIFAESGAKVRISGEAQVKDNIFIIAELGEDTIEMGRKGEGKQMHYITFGSYPQTYVADMQSVLENWYVDQEPIGSYDSGFYLNNPEYFAEYNWYAYKYIDGQIYVRGKCFVSVEGNSFYQDGTDALLTTDNFTWFRVDPIRWIILNYDQWQSGQPMELISELAIVGGFHFRDASGVDYDGLNNWETSFIRQWLNQGFLNTAFTAKEKELIVSTHLKNNITNEYANDPSTWTGAETDDKVYMLSYYDVANPSGVFENNSSLRLASPSDFAVGNSIWCSTTGSAYTTAHTERTCTWWLRSAGSSSGDYSSDIYACVTFIDGDLYTDNRINAVHSCFSGIRPALRINFK